MYIDEMYEIITQDSSLDKNKDKDKNKHRIRINFCNRVKLITGLCLNKSMKRLVEKGEKLINRDLDMMDVFKRSKHHHKLLRDHPNH